MDFARSDVRTSSRGSWLFERIVATGSLVLKELGGTRAGEVAIQRYLASGYVTPEVIVETLCAGTASACAGRRVVAAQDTTEVNFSGRGLKRSGLGAGGDGKSLGFFIHPVVAIDAQDETVLGLAHARIWTRGLEPAGPRPRRPIDDKESVRWLEGARAASSVLASAAHVVVVADREADLYTGFARRPGNVDILVRARHDRALSHGGSMVAAAASWPVRLEDEVRVAPSRIGDKARIARVVIRSNRVTIKRPASAAPDDPASLELGLVEVSEPDPPPGVEPLCWRLLTTLPVESGQQAQEAVRLYRLRWRIEEVFRALKKDGLGIEDTQVAAADRLFRLAAMGLGAAVRIIQLVDARDGSSRPMSDVLDPTLVEATAKLVKVCEGATDRQKNPHPKASLAWLAWVVARYGGWNCYGKPPGPKTMAKGWTRLTATLAGVIIATDQLP